MVQQYLKPENLVPTNQTFPTIAQELTRGKTNDLARARAIYDHVMDKVRYARYGSGWGRGDAVYACDARSGNCTDFHVYFLAYPVMEMDGKPIKVKTEFAFRRP
jgi:transglutaminase-like putative cysteine protease